MGRLQDALDGAKERLATAKADVAKYSEQVTTLTRAVKDKAFAEAMEDILGQSAPRKPKEAGVAGKTRRTITCKGCGGEGHRSDSKECPKNQTAATVAVKTATSTINTVPMQMTNPRIDAGVRRLTPLTELAKEWRVTITRLWRVLKDNRIEPAMVNSVAHLRAEDVERVKELCENERTGS